MLKVVEKQIDKHPIMLYVYLDEFRDPEYEV